MRSIQKAIAKVLATCAVFAATASVSHATVYNYATDVRWDNGSHATPSSTIGNRYNQGSALGTPNATFLSLGLGGIAIFDFGVEFDAAAIVFETTFGSRPSYVEYANVYVADSSYLTTFAGLNASNGGATIPSTSGFSFVQQINNQAESTVIDLSSYDGPFRYVLLQDASPNLGASYDGFDVNAVGVSPVPEPGTVMLFGLGIVGVAIYSKRRKNSKA